MHMVRNSLKYESWKDYKAVTNVLKMVYQAPTEEAALMELNNFAVAWHDKYPQVSKSWRAYWVKWFTEFGHLNRGDMLTSEQYRCSNEKKKFQS